MSRKLKPSQKGKKPKDNSSPFAMETSEGSKFFVIDLGDPEPEIDWEGHGIDYNPYKVTPEVSYYPEDGLQIPKIHISAIPKKIEVVFDYGHAFDSEPTEKGNLVYVSINKEQIKLLNANSKYNAIIDSIIKVMETEYVYVNQPIKEAV